MSDITLEDFARKLDQLGKNDLILDVRTAGEFAEGHIPGAKNITHEEVASHAAELKRYDNIYIHCRRGGRAQTAYDALRMAGLSNLHCVYDAGMEVWLQKGYPVEK